MDPYKVLGVNPSDDEETIKKAYRNLVKKYHPDRYQNTPMADMATEKLKEINEAYDMITNGKTGKEQSSGYSGYGTYSGREYKSSYSVSFQSVRMLIFQRRFAEAEVMLSQLAQNAEWFYLMGIIYINRGWYDRGYEYIRRAASLDPDNQEYKNTAQSFANRAGGYREFSREYTSCCEPGILNCLCGSLLCSRCCCC